MNVNHNSVKINKDMNKTSHTPAQFQK